MMKKSERVQRLPAEVRFAAELEKLRQHDDSPVPPGWQMSPIAVEKFISGDAALGVGRKFVAEEGVVRRIVISLCTNRGCFLVGEPGTAKSWVSELLAAAVSGDSTLLIQGSAVSSVSQLLYDWDRAALARSGPHRQALIPGPLYRGMRDGKLVRFEELSRCPQSLQDAILSVLSERIISIPELGDDDGTLYAAPGFNIVGTSNSVDEGVNKMSVALRRRLNFETIRPIRRLQDEIDVVLQELAMLNENSGIHLVPEPTVIEVLVTMFHELRSGQSLDGRSTHRLAGAALSTAEAINVAHALSVYAFYYHEGVMRVEDLVHFIIGAALKDKPDDRRRLKYYFENEISQKPGKAWQAIYQQRELL
ncbi:MAG: AAA family ATPase [Alcanivoracaceae bacterium]|nr:AAA family ATPase [Alcanivoracaceae bacterium]